MFRATYEGVQTQTVTAYLNITVRRNENRPQFNASEYRREIMENFPLGESVLQVRWGIEWLT